MAVIWMITHKYTFLQQAVRNVFYYEEIVGSPSAAEWQDIVDEIRADLVTHMQTYMVNDCTFEGIYYRNVGDPGYPSFYITPTSGTLTGSNADNPTATQVALLVSVKGNTVAPNRARSYMGGYSGSSMTNSVWNAPIRGAAENFIDVQTVLNAAGTNELQRVAARWNTTHTYVTAVNNIAGAAGVASIVPATQRRRRIGVGS